MVAFERSSVAVLVFLSLLLTRFGFRARDPVAEKEIRDGGSNPEPKTPNHPQRHREVDRLHDHWATGPRLA